MTKRVATPKQTAGGGFAFEDKVVGYCLVWMLAGTAPLQTPGRIIRVDCQVAVDGWEGFDDLLLTLSDGQQIHHHAFSLKSNLQFSKESAPAALVRAAWSQLLHYSSEAMDVENDGFGLICAPYPDPPKVAIQRLLIKVRQQTPSQLAARLPESGYASHAERSIHDSCSCPVDLAKGLSKEHVLPGNILKRMSVIELDFEAGVSSSEATALFVCSKLVQDGSNANAENLWNALCQVAQRVRTAGGGISREELLSEVRSVVELRELPDFAQDWHQIESWSCTELSAIPDSIGGAAKVHREEVVANVMGCLQTDRFVAVVGASGTGKTVIAKGIAEESNHIGNVLWFKGERLRPGYIEALGSYHHLRHPLKEVLSHGKHKSGLIVLDGAERLLDEADFAEFCLLLHTLEIEKEGNVWRLLATCREEAWERVQLSFMRAFGHSVLWKPVSVEYPRFKALTPVWESYPALRALAIRPHLSQVMRNLKVLDLLACAVTATGLDPDDRSWVGESELVKWYWQQVIREGKDGPRRDVFLRRLAAENGDASRFEMPEASFSSEDLSLIESLSQTLGTDAQRGTVYFTHDLIADWARFWVLVSHGQELVSFCKHRCKNPHWHAALRLYGVSLLEDDRTGEKWKSVITECPELGDLFLESLVFAGNSQELINNTWPVLLADEGSLLKAFLNRFQHVASIPNPQYMVLASTLNITSEEARTWERIPLWMYWLGLLYALAAHTDDLLRLAPIETAVLARTWLRHTPQDWPGREQAAALALAVGGQALRTGRHYHHSESHGQLPYTALLEAYPDKPDEVRELLLKAAGRRVPTKEDGAVFKHYEAPGTVTHMGSVFGGDRTAQEPWPDGPLFRIDDAFRAACLETDGLRGMMTNAPGVAREIILALLIEPRPPKMEFDYSRRSILPERTVCLEHDQDFYPRFYTRGPFLLFLRINPEVALRTVIKLVDFATERWIESHCPEQDGRRDINLPLADSIKCFIGDRDVYHWYHGVSHSTNITASALMAVEKWLYDCLDKEEAVDNWIDLILKTSQSMAFLGMLSEVGRYAPGLFAGPLRPLILVPDTYYLEMIYTLRGGHGFGTPVSFHEGEWFFKVAREWDGMNHRQLRIIDIAAHLFHQDAETRQALLSARKQWSELPDEGDEHWRQHKETLIATFDESNWKEVDLPDGKKGIAFEQPEHLKMPPEQLARLQKEGLLLTLPVHCRKMLEEQTPLAFEQILPFLQMGKELLRFEPEDKESARVSPSANAALGTVAVVFILHRDWLRANPKEEKWCEEILDRVLADPPPWSEFDVPESAGNYSWEHFACDLAPVIWAEHSANPKSRTRIARLAFARHYSAVGLLLASAFERREALGKDFWQLMNLLLDSAAIRYEILAVQDQGGKIDLTKQIRRAMKLFVKGKYSTDLPMWGQESLKKGKLWSAHNRHPQYYGREDVHLLSRVPKLDLQQIQATFNAVFLPDQATSEWERKRFLKFWDEALETALSTTRFFDRTGNGIDPELTEAGLPYKYDRWVLERVAVVIVQMQPGESPERYWKPILGLGARAEHWVEHFLDHWFMSAKKTIDKKAFVREWTRMLEFCLTSDSWQEGKGRSAVDLPHFWLSLVGLPRFMTSLWQTEDAPIIEEAGVYFTKVASHVLNSKYATVQLLSWLSESSAKGIRRLMLKPVAEAGLAATEYWWKEPNLGRAMARYLGLLWQDHRQALERAPAEKMMFLELVHRAAAMQEPMAMELQARIASQK